MDQDSIVWMYRLIGCSDLVILHVFLSNLKYSSFE